MASIRLIRSAGAAVILIVVVGFAGSFWPPNSSVPHIDSQEVAQVTLGEIVYMAQCARCHGVKLEGQHNWRVRLANGRMPAPPHDATGHTWHHADADLFNITKNGIGPYAPSGYQSDMPAFAGILSDSEIAAVLAYIKSRWPADIRNRQGRINENASQP
jgi:mono/diheme cytochrome c family protein